MTVEELKNKLSLTLFCGGESLQKNVTGGYAGDLLSWVMGRAKPGEAWVTIMSNQNVAAVALLADVSCVILSENVKPDDALLARAKSEKITLLGSSQHTFSVCTQLGGLLQKPGGL
jgi:serine kinase of HPr protein (carbohydrate metabolism regulator)